MVAFISGSSLLAILIRVITPIFLIVISLKKFTNGQIFESAGGFCIGGSVVSLLFAIYDLIMLVINTTDVKEFLSANTAPQIKFLLSIAKLAIGVTIYKSRRSVSVLSSIVICFAGLLSAIDYIVNPSFVSSFTFMVMFLPIMAILREFRNKRKRSK